jgi:hypothetical protein
MKPHLAMLPGQNCSESGMYLQRLLLNDIENPHLSAKSFILNKSPPQPPALNSHGFLVE